MKEIFKKHIIIISIVVVSIAAIFIGFSLAYFTSTPKSVINNFSAGKVTIEVVEENFDEENAKSTEPGQTITKDPKVSNIGNNSAYVFLQVEIPRRNVIKVGEDNVTLEERKVQDLFTYTVNDNWILVDTIEIKDVHNHGEEEYVEISTYIYAYTLILNPGQITNALFDSVTAISYLEGTLHQNDKIDINIKGLAVQSEGLKITGDSLQEKLVYIYENYIKE